MWSLIQAHLISIYCSTHLHFVTISSVQLLSPIGMPKLLGWPHPLLSHHAPHVITAIRNDIVLLPPCGRSYTCDYDYDLEHIRCHRRRPRKLCTCHIQHRKHRELHRRRDKLSMQFEGHLALQCNALCSESVFAIPLACFRPLLRSR